jgi:hypothetical protein
MHTLELSDAELRILHAALHAYLDDFGHEEADVLRQIKALIAKLPREHATDTTPFGMSRAEFEQLQERIEQGREQPSES